MTGYEVTRTPDFDEAQRLVAQGWRLVSVVGAGDNVLHYLDRHAPGTPLSVTDLPWLRTALEAAAAQLGTVEAERDRLVQALADEERRSIHYRDHADRLAAQIVELTTGLPAPPAAAYASRARIAGDES